MTKIIYPRTWQDTKREGIELKECVNCKELAVPKDRAVTVCVNCVQELKQALNSDKRRVINPLKYSKNIRLSDEQYKMLQEHAQYKVTGVSGVIREALNDYFNKIK